MSHGSGSYTRAMRLWASGMLVKDIASEVGVPYGTVMSWAYRNRDNFPARHSATRLTKRQREMIRLMRSNGMTYAAIAKAMGVCTNTVSRVVHNG